MCASPVPGQLVVCEPRRRQSADVEGRVLAIEQRTEEREFSWARFLILVVLGLLLLSVSLLAVAVLLVAWIFLGRTLRIGNAWLLFLNRRSREREMHQVLTMYVRTKNGERTVVAKGKRFRGGVQAGHYIQAWGASRGGVLWMRYGRNVSTSSEFGPI